MAAPGSVVIQFKAKADQARRDVLDFAKSLGRVDDEADKADRELAGLDDSFDKVGDEAQRAGDQVDNAGDDFDRLGTEARQAGDDVERAGDDVAGARQGFDQLGDEAEDTADRLRRAAQDMVRHVDDGADGVDASTQNMRRDMADTGSEIGGEFMENLAEGIGSGQISVEDAMAGTLGGIANMVSSFKGPFAVAAGIAATGLGVMFAYMKAESEKAKERLNGIIGAVEELGEVGSKEAKKLIFQQWLEPFKEAPGELVKIQKELERAGVDQKEWFDAITGSADAQDAVRRKLQLAGGEIIKNQKETGELTQEQKDYLDNLGPVIGILDDQNAALGDAEEYYDSIDWLTGKSADKTGRGADNADRWKDNVRGVEDAAKRADDALDDAAQDRTTQIKVSYVQQDSGWKPSQGPKGVSPGGAVQFVLPAPPTYVAPPTVVVTEEQIYQAVARLLLRGQARHGRLSVVT